MKKIGVLMFLFFLVGVKYVIMNTMPDTQDHDLSELKEDVEKFIAEVDIEPSEYLYYIEHASVIHDNDGIYIYKDSDGWHWRVSYEGQFVELVCRTTSGKDTMMCWIINSSIEGKIYDYFYTQQDLIDPLHSEPMAYYQTTIEFIRTASPVINNFTPGCSDKLMRKYNRILRNIIRYNEEVMELKTDVLHLLSLVDISHFNRFYYGFESGDGSLETEITRDASGWHLEDIERGRGYRSSTSERNEILYRIIARHVMPGRSDVETIGSKNENPELKRFANILNTFSQVNPNLSERLTDEFDSFVRYVKSGNNYFDQKYLIRETSALQDKVRRLLADVGLVLDKKIKFVLSEDDRWLHDDYEYYLHKDEKGWH